jgi:hypothetical protein
VGPRTGLAEVEWRKILPIPRLEVRPIGHPAHGQSLYRLCCPDLRIQRYVSIYLPTCSVSQIMSKVSNDWMISALRTEKIVEGTQKLPGGTDGKQGTFLSGSAGCRPRCDPRMIS